MNGFSERKKDRFQPFPSCPATVQENAFLFYDSDGDNLSEMAIRFVNTPTFRNKANTNSAFVKIDTAYDVPFNRKMHYIGLTWIWTMTMRRAMSLTSI